MKAKKLCARCKINRASKLGYCQQCLLLILKMYEKGFNEKKNNKFWKWAVKQNPIIKIIEKLSQK